MSTQTTRPGLAATIRIAAGVTVLASAVAATALVVRQHDQVTSVVVTVPIAPVAQPGPQPRSTVAPAPAQATPGAAVSPSPGAAVVPAAVPIGTSTAGANPGVAVPLHESQTAPQGTNGSVPLYSNLFAAAPVGTQPPCPLGWPAPQQQGGLASLIGLAPLAGPFSSEAFALGSVYQPILQLAGPVLAQIAPVITRNQPAIDVFTAQVQSVEAVVLQAILPYYGPYRDQLIAAEGNLARQLAPILDRAYDSPAASCLVAWQGQLIDQAKGGPIQVASLAHPGTVIELGPKR